MSIIKAKTDKEKRYRPSPLDATYAGAIPWVLLLPILIMAACALAGLLTETF